MALSAQVQLPVDIIELRKTMIMCREIAQDLLTVARAVKNPSALYSLVRRTDWGSKHLRHTYGVVPTVNSMIGVVEYLNDKLRAGIWYPFRLKAPDLVSTSHSLELYGSHKGLMVSQYWAKFDMLIKDPLLYDTSHLGFSQLASAGWELVPFSFVVDWFLPIGDYLSRMGAGISAIDIYWCYGINRRCTMDHVMLGSYSSIAQKCTKEGRYETVYGSKFRSSPRTHVAPSFLLRRELSHASSKLISALELLRQVRRT